VPEALRRNSHACPSLFGLARPTFQRRIQVLFQFRSSCDYCEHPCKKKSIFLQISLASSVNIRILHFANSLRMHG
jgi:hypothetical protein